MSSIEMNPAEYNTFTCLDTAGRLISKCSASELMVRLCSESICSIYRLLGSAITWKTSSLGCIVFCIGYQFINFLYVLQPARIHSSKYVKVCFLKAGMLQQQFGAVFGCRQCPYHYRVYRDLAFTRAAFPRIGKLF